LARFEAVPVEVWHVQEFTYLAPARCAHTLPVQRKPWAAQYWDASDPLAVDGLGAESFADFMWPVSTTLDRLAGLTLASVVVFGHGQFMQALRWSIAHRPQVIGADAMRSFRAFDLSNPIPNCAGFQAAYEDGFWSLVRAMGWTPLTDNGIDVPKWK
jgi:probable phosphoglycerate mutase